MLSFRIMVFLAVSYVVLAGYKQDALKQHNVYRAIHDAPPMKLKRDLNKAAVQYARELFDIGKLVHSKWESRQGQGENLAAGCKSSSAKEGMSVEGAVRAWYKEVCKYDFNKPGYSSAVGHFTQVVWKASTELGIGKYTGKRIDKKGKKVTCTYIVARYRKTGNIIDKKSFSKNVSKGSFDPSFCDNVRR